MIIKGEKPTPSSALITFSNTESKNSDTDMIIKVITTSSVLYLNYAYLLMILFLINVCVGGERRELWPMKVRFVEIHKYNLSIVVFRKWQLDN